MGRSITHDWEGVSLDLDERSRIAEKLQGKSVLIMRNHGFLSVGATAGECFMNMYYVIRLCEIVLQVTSSKLTLAPVSAQMWEKASKQYKNFPLGKYEWPDLLRLCERLDPSYKY